MPEADDPYDLRRFIEAQAPVYDRVRAELRGGRKQSHWMWFVFPQIAGLGSSAMARHYAIASLAEVKAYLGHPILRPRLLECTRLVLAIENRSAREIFGTPDDMKFRSCLTLFLHANQPKSLFRDALERYFGGEEDPLTVARL